MLNVERIQYIGINVEPTHNGWDADGELLELWKAMFLYHDVCSLR